MEKQDLFKKNKNRKSVIFAASSGGHFEQLMMLKPLMEEYDSVVVTERTKYNPNIVGARSEFLPQVNRKEPLVIFKLIGNSFKSLYLLHKYRPEAVITTGVLAMIPLCLLCKMFGAKLIYIESFAKISSPNKTGKFLYKYADRFYVQWEEMKEFYPKAIYLGSIY